MFVPLMAFILEPGILIPVALVLIGAVVWAVRVEGRVNGHDQTFEALKDLLEERDEHLTERHNSVINRLVRIEIKIDAGNLNGHK